MITLLEVQLFQILLSYKNAGYVVSINVASSKFLNYKNDTLSESVLKLINEKYENL